MKKISNQVMLITYGDSMGSDLKDLYGILDEHFEGVIGGVHILPFFPSSGDRGFAVINYDIVEPSFGDWADIEKFSEKYYLMADFMINHASIRCEEFKDYMRNGDASPYKDMFIHWEKFWPNGEPTEQELEALYRRKLGGPYKEFTREDGKTVKIWNTFFEEQVDIDPWSPVTKEYYKRNLERIAKYVPLIRFDAFAYASKRPGTSCFFVEPEVWDVLDIGMEPLKASGTEMLPEIHENYKIQLKMAEKGHWVYDFALPMLLLHGLLSGRTDRLVNWMKICPRKQFTTLDTHDGIGVVDVAGLLDEEEIEFVTERLNKKTEESRMYLKIPESIIKASGGKAKQYQLMCTYYSALDEDDAAYLVARIVQFYAPGIPQVYYVGLLAGENDLETLKRVGEPRSINRHNYTKAEIKDRVQYPMLKRMYEIMRFRNTYPAFDGEFSIDDGAENGLLKITWTKNSYITSLDADLRTKEYKITYTDENGTVNCL
ncbi:sucrose phosphorylase [Anaerobacterium chartisolvens]|uniref:Sucrose 6(F)-phosphate phosphorylase n=1 Tax=Anaerobacterium chartisolvens TaxID=1297424 RepID=A0A369BG75_9FIRM|nr:sucrose phosphorylase [Anaerobacterium chartisolvens]RCX19477.1 sucrose phosphorylase [Anaerobacterium chartisolvens]